VGSEQLIVDGELLAVKPKGLTWEEAAVFPVPVLTAAQALREAIPLNMAGPLLVNGAGGVTGGLTVALARLSGARVIATAGPTSVEGLKRLGIEAVYDYHDPDWPQAVSALTRGTGVPAAINAASGGERATLSAVAEGGRFATITGSPPKPERGVSIANVYVRADGVQLRELVQLLAKRELEVPHRLRSPTRPGSGRPDARNAPRRQRCCRAPPVAICRPQSMSPAVSRTEQL
jgi:NADPH:quinone reductase-like Zn-dependent oxidoreductase